MATRVIKRNDRAVTPWVRLLDEAGAPIDLTGATVVFTLRNAVTGVNKILRAAATVRDQTTYVGEVVYQFAAVDVDTAGYFQEEWECSYVSGYKESFPTGEPVSIHILEDFDAI